MRNESVVDAVEAGNRSVPAPETARIHRPGSDLNALAAVCSWMSPDAPGAELPLPMAALLSQELRGMGSPPRARGAWGNSGQLDDNASSISASSASSHSLAASAPNEYFTIGAVQCFSREDLYDDKTWAPAPMPGGSPPKPAGTYGRDSTTSSSSSQRSLKVSGSSKVSKSSKNSNRVPGAKTGKPRKTGEMKDEIAWLKAVSAPAPREPKAERARTHDYFGPSVQNKRYTKDDVEHFKFHHQPVGQAVQEYDVRCDWNTVDVDQLDAEFKAQYAYYPKANCPREEYKGTRWKFESEFNNLLFAFLHLNPDIREAGRYVHEKLIEAYRNDIPELQSRRARKKFVTRSPRETRASTAMQIAV